MATRKLLYHRGIDDEVGTYITDYIEAAMCFVFGSHLLMKTLFQSTSNIKSRTKNTVAVVIIEYSMGAGALLAGLVHQFLQQVYFIIVSQLFFYLIKDFFRNLIKMKYELYSYKLKYLVFSCKMLKNT